MSRQREGRLQRRIRKAIEREHGGFWFKVHGGPLQRAGLPDLLGWITAVPFGLEVKTTKGKLSKIQIETLIRMSEHGVAVEVITNARQATDFITDILAAKTATAKSSSLLRPSAIRGSALQAAIGKNVDRARRDRAVKAEEDIDRRSTHKQRVHVGKTHSRKIAERNPHRRSGKT